MSAVGMPGEIWRELNRVEPIDRWAYVSAGPGRASRRSEAKRQGWRRGGRLLVEPTQNMPYRRDQP